MTQVDEHLFFCYPTKRGTMTIHDSNMDTFDEGRRHAIAAVRKDMAQGVWTPRKRAVLLKGAVHLRQLHRSRAEQRTYYAGLISVLKSRLSGQFSGGVSPQHEYETGWDWDGDEDNFGRTW
jgi:hypothetical protein